MNVCLRSVRAMVEPGGAVVLAATVLKVILVDLVEREGSDGKERCRRHQQNASEIRTCPVERVARD